MSNPLILETKASGCTACNDCGSCSICLPIAALSMAVGIGTIANFE